MTTVKILVDNKEIESIDLYDGNHGRVCRSGEWQKISPAGIYECSCCGQNVMTSDIECYKFCHGCGAKMKGGEEE